jgi:uncharacterized cupin superfamily protein
LRLQQLGFAGVYKILLEREITPGSIKRESVNSPIIDVPKPILRINAGFAEMEPDPIPAEWILSGTPQARTNKLVTSRDWSSTVVVWDCTPGSFKWHYSKDETVHFLSGEAFMTDDDGEEHRFGAGDIAFFPAGTTCTWRVTDHIRKVAVVRETMWRPLGFVLKVSKKILRGEPWQVKPNANDQPTGSLANDR